MTRINTNIGSLVAQRTLSRSNSDLQTSLTRLSTGLRINVGKDDPAGLIASEALRSDITGVQKAISNATRANQVIATADSSLGQVSSLLNDIRGLVTEAANEGALSEEQIAANQLQIDSSLEAINRISQTTSFQGRKLLDGSLNFITSGSTPTVTDLKINQANLGSTGSISISVDITSAATQGLITNAIPASSAATSAAETITFADTSSIAISAAAAGASFNAEVVFATDGSASVAAVAASDTISFADGSTLDITATAAGTDFNDAQVVFATDGVAATPAVAAAKTLTFADTSTVTITAATAGSDPNGTALFFQTDAGVAAGQAVAVYDEANDRIIIKTDGVSATKANIATAVNALADFNAVSGGGGAGYVVADGVGSLGTIGSGANSVAGVDYDSGVTADYNSGTNTLTIHTSAVGALKADIAAAVNLLSEFTATAGGAGTNYVVANDGTGALGSLFGGVDADTGVTADYDSITNQITVHTAAAGATKADIAAAIDGLDDFNATAGGGGVGYVVANDSTGVLGELTGGADEVTGILADLVVQISGGKGSDVFQFEAGASATQIRDAINLSSDATGVTATVNAGTLELRSSGYGSAAVVDVDVISEGTGGTFESLLSATRDTGTDIVATLNGVTANGKGNTLSISTATLSLSATVADGSSTDFTFDITGGGALFQLGPDIVGNQQARLGIQSVNTARLGGASGKLFELASGGSKALGVDYSGAAAVVEEAILSVTQIRGRLGAFQRTTIDSGIAALSDTLVNLTDAESSIRDADFAAESAKLTRAQILVQSGTSVLQIANQQPQNVLALLR